MSLNLEFDTNTGQECFIFIVINEKKNTTREKTADNDERGVTIAQFICVHTSNVSNDTKMFYGLPLCYSTL